MKLKKGFIQHLSASMFKRMKLSNFRKSAGFTLVELLTVVGILGILVSATLFTLNPIGQLQKSWDAGRKSDLEQIQRGLETYYHDFGRYPAVASCAHEISGSNDLLNDCIEWGTSWAPYMAKIPKDPSGSKQYVYYANSTGQAYWLYTSLDRGTPSVAGGVPSDPNACPNGICPSLATNGIAPNSCGGGSSSTIMCNYAVSSSNVSP